MTKDRQLESLRNLLAFGEESIRLFKDMDREFRHFGAKMSVSFFELHLSYWRQETGLIRMKIMELERNAPGV